MPSGPIGGHIADERLNLTINNRCGAGGPEAVTSILPSLNVKTARLWRAIVPSTHLAREGRMTVTIGRRELLAALGGAVAAWPPAAWAQRPDRMRRVGVLMHLAADDPEGQSRVAAFLQGLQEAGWAVGRNVNIDVRWAAGEADRFRRYAMEIVALTPDVILTSAPPSIRAMQQATRTVPIVYVLIPDAVGTGIVDSLSRPGGNTTGFTSTELGMPVKWLELLKDIAPKMTRAAVLRDAADATAIGQFGAVKGAAPSFGVEISPIGVANAEEIERGIIAFAREPNGGLIVLPVPTTVINRTLIIKLAAQHRLPAVYNSRY